MNPQNDHYLFELNRHHLHQPMANKHDLPELAEKSASWKEYISNSIQYFGRLQKIRIQIVFEVSEPCPDGC
jgi:hypothetical protein